MPAYSWCPDADRKALSLCAQALPAGTLNSVTAGGSGAQGPGLGVQQVRREEPGHGLL